MARRGLVIGCGGTLGFAWTAVALTALERELGWDARATEVLVGTSAGAEVVAMLGAGVSAGEVLAALDGAGGDPRIARHVERHPGMTPPLPGLGLPATGLALAGLRRRVDATAALAGLLPKGRGDATWLRVLGTELAGENGWVDHQATWLVGADTRDGRRVAFGSPGAPTAALGDAIAASWAIPGWFPPVRIGSHSYLDGGTVSPTSADLVLPLGLDEVVVVAPMSSSGGAPARGLSRVERVLRRTMTRRLDAEVRLLEEAGTRVVRIEPGSEELDAMRPNFMDLRRRRAVLDASRRATPARVHTALQHAERAEHAQRGVRR